MDQTDRRDRLIEAELNALRRYARALARDIDQANDLVQETVMKGLAQFDQWRGEGPIKPWLFTILRNSFRQHQRAEGRWRTVAAEVGHAAEPRAATPVDPLYLRQFEAALAELTVDQREVLMLVGVEGLSYAETAALTETPIGTVMSRLSRARTRLRELVGDV